MIGDYLSYTGSPTTTAIYAKTNNITRKRQVRPLKNYFALEKIGLYDAVTNENFLGNRVIRKPQVEVLDDVVF